VSDAFTTGVIDQVRPAALHDTGRVPIVDTGEVRAVGMGAPRILKVLVGVVATLVVLGGVGLIEHARLNDWVHDGRTSTSRWYADVKSALGITSKSSSSGHTSSVTPPPKTSTSHPATDTTKITLTPNPDGQSVAIDVHASSFTVKILATPGDCWVQATVAGQPQPIFGQVLQANQSHSFTVTHSMTINTGSSSGRAYLYRGTKLIGFYFPTKAPFLMQFNPVG